MKGRGRGDALAFPGNAPRSEGRSGVRLRAGRCGSGLAITCRVWGRRTQAGSRHAAGRQQASIASGPSLTILRQPRPAMPMLLWLVGHLPARHRVGKGRSNVPGQGTVRASPSQVRVRVRDSVESSRGRRRLFRIWAWSELSGALSGARHYGEFSDIFIYLADFVNL